MNTFYLSWILFAAGWLLALGFAPPAAYSDSGPPNFVVILADDLGYGDLGCYGSRIRTPHLDRLASDGIRFTDFHSNGAMCTPTRAALLTGRYQQRFGNAFEGPLSGETQRDVGLPLAAVTIAEALKPLGYATAMHGKWHLGYQAPFLPTRQGFDQFVGLTSGDGDHHSHVDRSGNADWWRDEQLRPEQGYTADLLTRHSCKFIERNCDQPFFLYVPHLAIHFPWQGPNDPAHRAKGVDYAEDKWGVLEDPKNVRPHVQAMIEALDQSVGTIVHTLQRLGLRENTFVLFLSDNGGYLSYGDTHDNISSNGPLRGQKGDLFEGGHRVPAIACWPNHIEPGVCDEAIMTFDIFPTLLELATGQPETRSELDGTSFASVLTGAVTKPDRTLFWRANGSFAVRHGDWKLVAYRGRPPLLFDLRTDVGERTNLANEQQDRVRELSNSYTLWAADVTNNGQ